MNFQDLLKHTRDEAFAESVQDITIVGIDPGETTGICAFQGTELVHSSQLNTKSVPEGAANINQYLEYAGLNLPSSRRLIVMEEYRVYSWKTKTHAWAGLHTPRLIGAIEYIAFIRGTKLVVQSAGEGKGFCTDEKLQEWGMYQVAKRHANDAIRHVCHNLLFTKKVDYENLR